MNSQEQHVRNTLRLKFKELKSIPDYESFDYLEYIEWLEDIVLSSTENTWISVGDWLPEDADTEYVVKNKEDGSVSIWFGYEIRERHFEITHWKPILTTKRK